MKTWLRFWERNAVWAILFIGFVTVICKPLTSYEMRITTTWDGLGMLGRAAGCTLSVRVLYQWILPRIPFVKNWGLVLCRWAAFAFLSFVIFYIIGATVGTAITSGKEYESSAMVFT